MKTILNCSLILIMLLTLVGCFNTELVAPDNHSVVVMPAQKPAKFHKTYKNWYLFAGVLPIYTTQPEEIIAKQKLIEARVQTEDTISDGVITLLTSFLFLGLFPQTVVVEGNTAIDLTMPEQQFKTE